MSQARWERLVGTLAEHGVHAKVDERAYPGGVTHSITLRTADGLIGVHDKWWRKNPEVWIGWQVHTEDRESIITRTWPLTKKRGEVARAVKEAIG